MVRRITLFSALISCALPSPAIGQTLTVKTVDAATGATVPAAMVTALGTKDSLLAGGFTSESGQYVFRNLKANPVSIVARHIGFAPARVDLKSAAASSSVIAVKLTRLPNLLSAVVTREESECRDLSAGGVAISQVWENVRSALEATRFAQDQGLVRIEIERYEQDLTRTFAAVAGRTVKRRELTTGQPFAAASDAALAQGGYVVGTGSSVMYYAPDARTLLSPDFTATHCFSIRRAKRGDDPSLIGLTFRPRSHLPGANVSGTLWVNRESGGLDRLVFEYVNVEAPIPIDGVGGRLDFHQLAGGAWIITHWHILTPRLGRFQRVSSTGREAVDTLLGFREAGGNARVLAPNEAVAALESSVGPGALLEPPTSAASSFPECSPSQREHGVTLQGSIRDSAGIPIENSKLRIEWIAVDLRSRSGRAVATGARGQIIDVEPDGNGLFSVCNLPPSAEYRAHLSVDGRPIEKREIPASAVPTTITLDFVVSPRRMQATSVSSIVGLVRDDAAQPKPIANAEVQVAGQTARTDSTGRFVLNGIAAAVQDVTIKRVGFVPLKTSLDFSAAKPLARVFVLSPIRTQLDTVEVRAARVLPFLEPFEERRRRGIGSYITREQFDKQRDRKTSEILQSLPAIKIVSMGAGDAAVAGMRGGKGLTSKSKGGDAFDKMRGADPKACYAQVFVDGVRVFAPEPDAPLFNINSLTPNVIEGVEYYRGPAETPAQYQTSQAECGTVLIWTRRGDPSK